MGGPLNIRGYRWNSLGPKDHNYNLGGDIMVNFGLHAYFPLPVFKNSNFVQENVRMHLFSNAGCLELFEPNYGELAKLNLYYY